MSEQELRFDLNTPSEVAAPPAEAPDSPVVDVPNVGQVSMDELVKGYMRQADYTQKTQALAQDRQDVEFAKSLAQMFDSDPKAAIEALSQEFNVSLGEAREVLEAASDNRDDEDVPLPRAVEDRLDRVDRFIDTAIQREWQAQIQREVAQVQKEFSDMGIEIDEVELITHAHTKGIPDLKEAAKSLSWDKQYGRGRESGLSEVDARVAATVEGASHGAGGEEEVNSFEDAWNAAKRKFSRQR